MSKKGEIKIFFSQPMTGFSTDEIKTERSLMEIEFEDCMALSAEDAKLYLKKPLLDIHALANNPMIDIKYVDQISANIELETLAEMQCTTVGSLEYLGHDITMMHEVDLVIFHPNYKKSKGAMVELSVCKIYGIPYVFMDKHYKLRHRKKR